MINATPEFLKQNEELYKKRKKKILESQDSLKIKGTTYYVSTDGDDSNDGKTPETSWKTLNRVNNTWFSHGDGVMFKRGDLFRGEVQTQPGISYGAYGTGAKPKFYGWDENLANPSLWIQIDSENHIWKYTKKILDPGTLVFNEGEEHCRKLIPTYKNLQFVCRDDETCIFDMKKEMTQDLDLFWHFDQLLTRNPSKGEDFPVPCTGNNCFGDLYIRCDKGNPGEVFNSIEAIVFRFAFMVGENPDVKIDNLCIKYYCFGVVANGHSVGLSVTNCEIGWIGGCIQHYFGTDPNYPQGTRGTVTRFGNGVEIYGGCENYNVSDCYIYQSYDAAMTHQINTTKKIIMKGIRYTDNLIENCVYGIEYFLDQLEDESESYMEDVVMSNNIIRLAGYGWGQQRHNTDTPALIKGWSYTNTATDYTICNNIFDRSAYRMLHLVALKDKYCPKMYGNTYIQHLGGMIGQFGGNEFKEPDILIFDEESEEKISNIFGDKDAKIYFIK